MLSQRRRRWANITGTPVQRLTNQFAYALQFDNRHDNHPTVCGANSLIYYTAIFNPLC